jgi:hypothetical protein
MATNAIEFEIRVESGNTENSNGGSGVLSSESSSRRSSTNSWTSTGPMTVTQYRRRIYRNLIIFSFSSLLYNSSQNGLDTLQTSLYSSNNLGLLVHLTSSAISALFCFFLPIMSFKLLGFKWTLVVAQAISTTYIVANQIGDSYTLMPAAALHGVSNLVLYALHGSFIAVLAKDYCAYSKSSRTKTLFRFFTINSSITQLSECLFLLFVDVFLSVAK